MEVHHHSHTERKKWTHYVWEFLMLFLAVFCGFLAENQREHIVEHRREKDYMVAMIQDLRSDTMLINRCIKQVDFIIPGHDTLEFYLQKINNDPESLQKLYYANTAFTLNDFSVDWTQGTFEELKGSGNLRLIDNKHVKQKLLEYETAKKWSEDQHAYVSESISKAYYFATDVFDVTEYGKYNNFLNENWPSNTFLPYDSVKQFLSSKPQLLTYNKVTIKKYERLVNNEKVQIMTYRTYIKTAKEKALDLMHTIESEYHLK
jgi:hypothetical protein